MHARLLQFLHLPVPGLQTQSIFISSFKFEFNMFIFASSSSSSAKIYQVFWDSENKVIDLA